MQAKYPSLRTLYRVFKDADTAQKARKVLMMHRDELLKTMADPRPFYLSLEEDVLRMWVLNALMDALYGVETGQIGNEHFDYLNTGDSYAPTIIFWRGRYRVQSVGDFVEKNDRKRNLK